ncbi:MAG: hypothetical protein WCO64_08455 [Actinomycetes bacterium]
MTGVGHMSPEESEPLNHEDSTTNNIPESEKVVMNTVDQEMADEYSFTPQQAKAMSLYL